MHQPPPRVSKALSLGALSRVESTMPRRVESWCATAVGPGSWDNRRKVGVCACDAGNGNMENTTTWRLLPPEWFTGSHRSALSWLGRLVWLVLSASAKSLSGPLIRGKVRCVCELLLVIMWEQRSSHNSILWLAETWSWDSRFLTMVHAHLVPVYSKPIISPLECRSCCTPSHPSTQFTWFCLPSYYYSNATLFTEVTAKSPESRGVLPVSLTRHLASRVTVKLVVYRLELPNFRACAACSNH